MPCKFHEICCAKYPEFGLAQEPCIAKLDFLGCYQEAGPPNPVPKIPTPVIPTGSTCKDWGSCPLANKSCPPAGCDYQKYVTPTRWDEI